MSIGVLDVFPTTFTNVQRTVDNDCVDCVDSHCATLFTKGTFAERMHHGSNEVDDDNVQRP